MNKITLLLFVAVIGLVLYLKFKPLSRIQKIDWLNSTIGSNPAWVQMNDGELNTTYEFFKMFISKLPISDELKQRWIIVNEKYKIST